MAYYVALIGANSGICQMFLKSMYFVGDQKNMNPKNTPPWGNFWISWGIFLTLYISVTKHEN